MENKNTFTKFLIYFLIYLLTSAVIYFFNIRRLYLIFNTGLAFIPFILTSYGKREKTRGIFLILAVLVAIIFYPNCIYMFTDFIHIQRSDYYTNINQVIYVFNYLNWLRLGTDLIMILLSLILGYESFVNLVTIFKCRGHILAEFILLIFFSGLASLGVYLGRFIRLNSWDILNPLSLKIQITDIISKMNLNDYYLLCVFAGVHFLVILLFANLKR